MMRSLYLLVLTGLLLAGCGSAVPVNKRDNLAYLYGKGGSQMMLQARVHHISPDRSRVYYKLNTRDILYKSDGTGGPFHASMRISYESYDAYGGKVLLDSASTLIDDESLDPTEDRELIGSIDLRRKEQQPFILKVMVRDLNRDMETTVYVPVERDGMGIRQYFMPVDTAYGLPLFSDHFNGGVVKVRCEVCANKELRGTHHPLDPVLPAPVFTSGNTVEAVGVEVDSTFVIQVNGDGEFTMDLGRPGTYHLLPDTAERAGYTLFSVDDAYPFVSSASDMLKPLRYITSNQEFDRITNATDVRRSIEKFWIDAAGDRERAREAIRIYYGRVENANRHFTAEVEGWRTDRGLVHIIFGTPTSIYRTDSQETWIYGEENNLMSLTFQFKRRKTAYSDNDLLLQRDPLLKGAWYRNVESWRNGRVYQN